MYKIGEYVQALEANQNAQLEAGEVYKVVGMNQTNNTEWDIEVQHNVDTDYVVRVLSQDIKKFEWLV